MIRSRLTGIAEFQTWFGITGLLTVESTMPGEERAA